MAITIQPAYNPLPAYRPIQFEATYASTGSKTTDTALVKLFRNGVEIVEFSVKTITTDTFTIDVSEYVQDSLIPDTALPLAFSSAATDNVDLYADYYIEVRYKQIDTTDGLLKDVAGVVDTSDTYVAAAITRQHTESMDLQAYTGIVGTLNGKFLTKMPAKINVCKEDNHFLSYITPDSATTYDGIRIQAYTAAGSFIGGNVLEAPSNSLPDVISLNVGFDNLSALTYVTPAQLPGPVLIPPFSFSDTSIAYYLVDFGNLFFDGVNWNYIPNSEFKRFDLSGECGCDRRNVRLHWLNSLGGVDSYTFNSVKQLQQQSTGVIAHKALSWNKASAEPHNVNDVGKIKIKSTVERFYQLTSQPLTNDLATSLADMLSSTKVYIEDNGQFVPVIIDDVTQDISTQDGKIRYNIVVRFSNNTIIQRI